MTPKQFKEKFPQYKHLEGDALWDKMTEVLASCGNVLYADPDREVIYHSPVSLNDGTKVFVEDESKTKWLDKDGNPAARYIAGIDPVTEPTESYKFDIFNLGQIK